jgi:hypothetical protein
MLFSPFSSSNRQARPDSKVTSTQMTLKGD